MTQALKSAPLMALSLLLIAPRVSGEMVTWEFTGEIKFVDSDLGENLVYGDPFYALISFDPDTPDVDPSPNVSFFENAIQMIAGELGIVSFSGPSGEIGNGIGIQHFHLGDSWLFASRVLVDDQLARLIVRFGVQHTNTLHANGLFPKLPHPDDIVGAEFRIVSDNSSVYFDVGGTIHSIIPEPETGAMLLLGTLALIFGFGVNRQRSRRPHGVDHTQRSHAARHRYDSVGASPVSLF